MVMGGDLCSKSWGFESQHRILHVPKFTGCLKRPKKKNSPFKKLLGNHESTPPNTY